MSRLLLDTSAYSATRRGDERLREPLAQADEIVVTPVVIGELLYGFLGGGRVRENRKRLEEFLAAPRVRVRQIDSETAEHYAAIRDHLRKAGTPISANDMWIAASAAQHGLRLLTLDADFRQVAQVLVEYFEPQ